ncbi:MAG: SH3 domain-containing protein [Chitinispirillales bacterium]|jgi:hypothetical protein|nr:SH3 domain-containing protein [Chitinispirillales bacterium]
MRLARFLGLAVIMAGVLFSVFADNEDAIQYVEVKKAFQNVYTKLDPKSDIIRQTKKGEYLELLVKGESGGWYKVKVDGKEGYLEAKAGRVVNKKGAQFITLLLYIALLACCAAGVVLYVKKQQRPYAAGAGRGGDDDVDLDDDDD